MEQERLSIRMLVVAVPCRAASVLNFCTFSNQRSCEIHKLLGRERDVLKGADIHLGYSAIFN